jgi:hypothetical protein
MNSRINDASEFPSMERTSHCLLIQVDPVRLMVPRIMVAEVINYEGVEFSSSLNRDIRIFEWRGFQVPMISAAIVNPRCRGSTATLNKIVLFHGLSNRERLPFYAFGVAGNPKLVVVSAAAVEEDGEQSEGLDGELCRVRLADEPAVIPDVDHFEKFIYSNFFH